ncbi:MAG TPA: DUF2111 domain-containing protein [Methanothrix sp.]|nr:DUF2111 domain-containing protein [Methanothrix sp.]HPT19740.1 DUF2111 domain-containing protein [Methanothrix sp.]
MSRLALSEEAGPDDLAPLALAINEIVRLPVTMRSARAPGVRVEKGQVIDRSYSGPILEEVIRTGKSIRVTPEVGAYKGIPVSVAPIIIEGKAALALGIVDVIGTIDIPEVFGAYGEVLRQVSGGSALKR